MNRKNMFAGLKVSMMAAALTALAACDRNDVQSISGVIWGTSYHITAIGDVKADTGALIVATLDTLNESLNMFESSTEIGRFNRDGEADVSGDFMAVLGESRTISRLTGGAFDPTVGPLIEYWGFGTSKDIDNTADTTALKQIMKAVGLENISATGNHVVRLNPESRLDFGAIAKGHAVDRVTESLARIGYQSAMVEIGGEVRTFGPNPDGQRWLIQIDAPVRDRSGNHVRLGILELSDGAVATSGNYRNFRELPDGRIVGHTVSPVTGTPIETDILSATIIGSTCMRADALATAAMVMGQEKSTALLDSLIRIPDSGVYGAILVTSDDSINMIGLPSEHAKFTPTAK